MDNKLLFFFLWDFWSILVYTQAESDGLIEHKVEHVSLPTILPQFWFEMKLIKHELMSLGAMMNGLENKLNNKLNQRTIGPVSLT